MAFELIGARLMGPFFGGSIYVWTSIIAVILASLSLGNLIGGFLADIIPKVELLSLALFFSSLAILIVGVTEYRVIYWVAQRNYDLRVLTLVVSGLLFFIPSLFLGTIVPIATRLRVDDLSCSGSTVGRIYAISTVGSIFGTFLCGFFLFSQFGAVKLLFYSAAILFSISLALAAVSFAGVKLIFSLALLFVSVNFCVAPYSGEGRLVFDSAYQRIFVKETIFKERRVKIMQVSPFSWESAMYIDSPNELVADYMSYFDLALKIRPDTERVLLLGGGAYSYPKHFLENYQNARLDIVEIDPVTKALAHEFFHFKDDPRLRHFYEDARIYINRTEERYGVVLIDVFSTPPQIPSHLCSDESFAAINRITAEDALLVINLVSSLEGESGSFLRAFYWTMKKHFPEVLVFADQRPEKRQLPQNITLLGAKGKIGNLEDLVEQKKIWRGEIENDFELLTDSFAPVEALIIPTVKLMKRYIP